MNVLDKFLRSVSYKFPKGYPDMNDEQDVLLLEYELRKLDIGINLKEGVADAKIVKTLIDNNPGFFDTQSDIRRITNQQKISAEEFVKIVKDTFNIENVTVHPPNSGPNKKLVSKHSSSTFNMFEFNVDDKTYLIILSGGASANKGQDYEDKIFLGLKDIINTPIEDIEDPIIKDLLNKLGVNPLNIKSVEQTGGVDTKRTINPYEGAKDRGEIISDITLKTNDKTYYLSIKNKTGDNIYNGGNVSSIVYNKNTNKIDFDKSKFYSDELKSTIFDMFNIDPLKVVEGLNNYIEGVGDVPTWESINVDKDTVQKLLSSAIDYGYYYVREEGNGVKVIHLDSPESVKDLIGDIDKAEIKYPGNGVKSTYARIFLKNSLQGLRYIEVQIRNSQGGIGSPSIKIQTK